MLEPTNLSPVFPQSGAMTLLCDCVGARAGERLLIVQEPADAGYYDEEAPKSTAAAARTMGLKVYQTQAPSGISNNEDMCWFLDTLRGFDHVIFFSRVGDQIRFTIGQDLPPATMVYALERDSLESSFGTACHAGLCEVRDAIDSAFLNAQDIRVTCPLGSNYTGLQTSTTQTIADVSLKRFPMLVPRPIPANEFSGQIVLSRFLVGTGNRSYEPWYLTLESNVIAHLEGNRITEFEGHAIDVKKVREHYQHVADLFNIDPWFVHSWHAGIHPACEFNHDATGDIHRWAGSVFGNPRLLHFHTCGSFAPGEISWNIVDPTIYLDGTAIWQNGKLQLEHLPNGSELIKSHPRLAQLYTQPQRNIGLF